MIEQMMRCFVNPACCRVMMGVMARGQATAGQLQADLGDIPAASLYRYLKQLHQAGIIEVVSQRRVRGAVERVYAARAAMGEEANGRLRDNPGPTLMAMYSAFSMQLMNQFAAYCAKEAIDLENDGFSFTVCPVYATSQELRDALNQIGLILTKLVNQPPAPERRHHSIAVIATPPQEA